jgi:hypothetical protein
MIHGDEFGPIDWVFMMVAPPLVGCAIGLLISANRRQPVLAALGGIAGGTAGAWLGIGVYRWLMDEVIGGRDNGIFAAITISCFFLGAIGLSWMLSGQRRDVAPHRRSLGAVGIGLTIACAFITFVGVSIYLAASEPSAHLPMGVGVKYFGIITIVGGASSLIAGLVWLRSKANPA